jgi:SAM-dependent methyltransferase
MYTTRHFPGSFRSRSGDAFIRRALRYYGARALKQKARSIVRPGTERWRDVESVRAAYDAERAYTLEHAGKLSFDELVYGSADRFDQVPDSDFILIDDRVVWGRTADSRRFLVEEMERQVAALVPSGGLVLEIGSGNGRNLLNLKRRFPDRRFFGLELSPVSVQLARQLSARFGIPVEFATANACEPFPSAVPPDVHLVYSSHALEMMPRSFTGAVRNLLHFSRAHALFFEPVPELWPASARGWASHLRAYVMDRLRGFMPALARELRSQDAWRLSSARRLGTSTNPINETCLVHVTRIR